MKNALQDKHVVVTGGTGALGQAVVSTLLAAGAELQLPCFEAKAPQDFGYADHPRVHCRWDIDLADEQQVVAYYEALPALWASVHCTGGFSMAAIADTSLAELEGMWRLNAATCFLCCREAVRSMRRAGAGGRIVNVSARAALESSPGMVAYTAAKAAVASMTRTLGRELAGEDILVNAIAPSILDSAANRRAMPDADHASWPKPAEIAATIAWAVSPENRLTAGAVVPVYGKA